MKKGQIIEGKVLRVDFPNKGKVQCGEDIVSVKNVIPGQRISIRVDKVRNGRAEGRCIEVLEASPLEDDSIKCSHFGMCGGCVYQPVRYDEQLKIKEEQIKQLLDSVCSDYIFEGIKASPVSEEYRNKMEFSFGDSVKDGPMCLGMHKRGSFHDIVTVDECRIMDGDFRSILKVTLDYFAKEGIGFYKKLVHEGYLRHLLVRKAKRTGEILIDLVTTTQMDREQEERLLAGYICRLKELAGQGVLTEQGEAAGQGENAEQGDGAEQGEAAGQGAPVEQRVLAGKLVGVLHTYNDSMADVVQNDRTDILYGQDYFYEELLGLRFKITPFSFFQTNSLGAEVLYDTVRSYIGDTKDKVVFDLYSGTGTIAQLAAAVAEHVVGVEIVEEAVEAARVNAALNGLNNCEFIAGDVLKVLDEITQKPDLLVLDPPRDGIHPKALPKLISYGVDRIVYVSCKPTSLVRDLEVFMEAGYKLERAVAVDMFPGTANTETVVKLSLKKDTPKIEVTMEPDEESNYTPEEKATYQKIKDYVKDKYGVNVHTSYIAQVKRMCGLDMGENYNKSKKENPEVKQCPQEKVEYIKDALRQYNMI